MELEIFRAGDYGPKGRYTEQQLDQMVANYDPKLHEAPVVIGHPEHDKPAYGWVQSLRREGSTLFGTLRGLQPGFVDVMKSAFKKRSVALYPDFKGKGLYLRHLGFLGAMPPEVKGLADATFAEGEFSEIEFQPSSPLAQGGTSGGFLQEALMDKAEIKKTVVESVKEFFAEMFGQKARSASEGLTEDQVTAAVTKAVGAVEAKFSEKVVTLETDLKAAKTELAQVKGQSAAGNRLSKIQQFLEPLRQSGQLAPGIEKDGLCVFLESLDDAQQSVVFSEGTANQQMTQLDFALGWLAKLPKIVPFGELVDAKKEGKARKGVVQFADSPCIMPDTVEMAEAAQAIADEEKIPYRQALDRVQRQRRVQQSA